MDEPEQQPYCWATTLFCALLIAGAQYLFGCAGNGNLVGSDREPWNRPVWRASVVQDLAFDYKLDGIFNEFEWPAGVPPVVQAELKAEARRVVKNWDGQ